MRIAIFSDTYIPDINGVATSSFILREELIKLGHEVYVVTTELPSGSDYKDDDEGILRVPGLEVQALYGYRISSLYSVKGMKELKQLHIDLIHVQTEFGIGIFGRIAGDVLNVPVVYTYHTMYEDYTHYVNPISSKSIDNFCKKAVGQISKVYGDKCSELIVPSLKTKETLEKYGLKQENIYIIPTGLQLERFDPKNKNQNEMDKIIEKYNLKDKFVITFLGRVASEKSIDLVIRAINKLSKKHSNIRLLIVGGGPQLDELKELVNEDNINDIVTFTGPQDISRVPSFYHISNVFVSASLSETQGLTYIEAMASGTPVVARFDEQLTEYIDDKENGFFFKDEDELVSLLDELMGKDLTNISKNAVIKASNFSAENFAKKVYKVYEHAVINKHYIYTIQKIIPTRSGKNEVVFENDNLSMTLDLSDAIIKQYDLKPDKKIEHELFDTLKDLQYVSSCYNKALKYLTYRDYTYAEMRKKLLNKGDWDDVQLDACMELLVEKNLINDEAYTINYLKRSTRLGIGLNKCIYNLRNLGVSETIIDDCLEELNDDEEYQAAIALINNYYERNSYFNSQKQTINKIKQKLFIKGFTNDTIDRAMSDYDFSYNEEKEKIALDKEYNKMYARYIRKYNGKELKNKITDGLLKKGFNYDLIREKMNEGDFDDE
ncbi:MAG: RecX family transcriptional regulator [Thomasclavelia sp.]|nr:RecX family transcriptional regulator [Thomasclavelia sp.]